MPRKIMGRKLRKPSGEWSFVYGLVDPETKRIRYIGATKDLTMRYQNHVNPIAWWAAKKRGGTPVLAKTRWVHDLIERGLKPELRVLARARGSGAWRLEPEIIRQYAAAGEPLFNVGYNPRARTARDDPLEE